MAPTQPYNSSVIISFQEMVHNIAPASLYRLPWTAGKNTIGFCMSGRSGSRPCCAGCTFCSWWQSVAGRRFRPAFASQFSNTIQPSAAHVWSLTWYVPDLIVGVAIPVPPALIKRRGMNLQRLCNFIFIFDKYSNIAYIFIAYSFKMFCNEKCSSSVIFSWKISIITNPLTAFIT